MDIQIRPATADDYRELARIDGISYGAVFTEEDFSDTFKEPPSFLVALDGARIVGVSGDYRFTMTVPGGALIEVPGLTWVSVLPTHRRRGVLTELMRHQLAGYADAGDPVAVLTASEGGIYRRFGYGPATREHKTVLDRRFARLITAVDTSAVEFLPKEQVRAVLPGIHQRWCEQTPGALTRNEGWWDLLLLDRQAHREGMSETFYLVHPDGYLSYRVAENWNEGLPAHRCEIIDYRMVTEQAHAALWQVLLNLDLFGTIESRQIPADDQLPFLLTNSRQVQTVAASDGLWLCPVDVPAALSQRRYLVDIDAVIEVAGQRLRLSGGPDGASCTVTDAAAEASFTLPGLGSAYLGGHRVNTLARAGLVRANRAGLLSQLDLAFGADRAPEYGTHF